MNAALGSTPLSSPLESPDIIHTFVPMSDIGAATTSMASIKLSSMDSLPLKNHHHHHHQVRPIRITSSTNSILSGSSRIVTTSKTSSATNLMGSTKLSSLINNNMKLHLLQSTSSTSSSSATTVANIIHSSTNNNNNSKSLSALPETISELPELLASANSGGGSEAKLLSKSYNDENDTTTTTSDYRSASSLGYSKMGAGPPRKLSRDCLNSIKPLLEFSLSSVGRSFIDENDDDTDEVWTHPEESLATPNTPPPNVSPSTSSNKCSDEGKFSETFSSDFQQEFPDDDDPDANVVEPSTPSYIVSPIRDDDDDPNFLEKNNFEGSWDFLELDLDFHEVNMDPSFGGDVQECIFFGDDPFGVLPCRPTPPDSLDL